MRPSTSGSRDVIASTLSRFTCAVPVMSTCVPAGVGTACRLSSWSSERSENSGAVLSTVRNALPETSPVGADGGPARLPATKVPIGAERPKRPAPETGLRRSLRCRRGRGRLCSGQRPSLRCRSCWRSLGVTGRRPGVQRRSSATPGRRESPTAAEERRAQQHEHRDAGQPDGNGAVHGACCAAIPEPLLDGDRRRLGPAEHAPGEPTDVQRIEAVTDENQSRGCNHDGGGGGECDGGDPGVSRTTSGNAWGTAPAPPSTAPRWWRRTRRFALPSTSFASGRFLARAVGQLVAIPADNQQRVVDR